MSKQKAAAAESNIKRVGDDEHLSIAELARKRAHIQAAADRFKAASRPLFASVYMPANVPIEISSADLLAAERALQELKSAAGVA